MKKENTTSFVLTKSNHIQIECEVNYVSGIFLVDTGASNSCINYLSASKFNIEFKKSNEIASSATNKISETYHSKNNRLKIGDCEITNFDIVLFDMTFINNSFKEKEINSLEGIIGSDILNQLNACINYKKKEIILEF